MCSSVQDHSGIQLCLPTSSHLFTGMQSFVMWSSPQRWLIVHSITGQWCRTLSSWNHREGITKSRMHLSTLDFSQALGVNRALGIYKMARPAVLHLIQNSASLPLPPPNPSICQIKQVCFFSYWRREGPTAAAKDWWGLEQPTCPPEPTLPAGWEREAAVCF